MPRSVLAGAPVLLVHAAEPSNCSQQSPVNAVQEAIKKEQAMHKIMNQVSPGHSQSGKERVASIAAAMSVPAWSVTMYLNKLRGYSLSMESQQLSLTRQITRLIRQVRSFLPRFLLERDLVLLAMPTFVISMSS